MRQLINRTRFVKADPYDLGLAREKSRVVKKGQGSLMVGAVAGGGPGRGAMPGTDKAFVKFSEVQKTYDGETLVVKNLNLDIAPGEFLTMLGPSGSGKTTTLMMLAGFEVPTHGSILLGGRSIEAMPPHKRDIGMVFQNYALFPHMTVEENLAFPLKVRKLGRTEIEARIKRALDMVRLGSYGKRRPGQLSGGQQQRVALARALVFDPKLVLMDEPLGALDKQLREQMQLEIKHIHEDLGVTVVYVTHDQGEALTMSDRIAVFNDGIIQQLAAPAELYERPQNAFVAQFIGENNRLHGKVLAMNGTTCNVEIAGGSNVQALAINVEAVGRPTVLSLRPERVQLNPTPGALPNVFSAQVAEVIYLGDHVRTRVSLCGHDDFVIKLPNSEGLVQLEPGAAITVGWKTEDCRALDAP
ncbi:putative spermidine/putrescine transport system ATP-binding protein [Bradyrhizobium sacchari]|uniref:Spermidine/putrescine import ATP-binding protein PotA n=2 Tax=Bradyrhizobium sacchari TaxID=1399419 RepID=A0A560HKG9_9BRAD|nr:putative spermidine/putrescine transport system ATP-binding protein [Bradyrhizobium sacchari]TWB46999.1 putative spermidine/putrescine transport system ATP-binding protein [Bradyrhizobium sacchari]TWB65889.1 putative spermidine/putrescine transport system ATP-binding protein [Bradyrhizobium sacchari]TWB65892.1 putative spermidine/putrescine transport system ATP-binding protein [Bradyrhizobium sacchari]